MNGCDPVDLIASGRVATLKTIRWSEPNMKESRALQHQI